MPQDKINLAPTYVVIGNGIAGVTAAEILRSEDSAADITVIADDPFPVYYRPALKDYLAGRVHEDKLWARPNSFYQDHRIRFLADRVVGIQAGQHAVQLQSGRQVGYDRLLLANGARAARLTCPGVELAGVTTLRTVADYQAVVSRLVIGTAHRGEWQRHAGPGNHRNAAPSRLPGNPFITPPHAVVGSAGCDGL